MKQVVSILLTVCMLVMYFPMFDIDVKAAAFDEKTYTLTGDQLEDIIGIAKTQVGYKEGNNSSQLDGTFAGNRNFTKYGKEFGSAEGAWCAYFVSWCAKKAGCLRSAMIYSSGAPSPYVATSKPYKTNGLGTYHAIRTYKLTNQDYFKPSYTPAVENYKPKRGDLAIYKGHVGLVIEDYDNSTGTFEMIDGNNDGKVTRRHVSISYSTNLIGFYTPEYVTNTIVHEHSYVVKTESAHPHYTYKECSCGISESLGRDTVSSCKKCFPLGNPTLTRTAIKTQRHAKFNRNNVDNATDYTLTLYRDGQACGTYSMNTDSYTVSGLVSGNYSAKLTVKNRNTGESKSVNCYGFIIADTYTVAYNANGGKNAPSSQTKIQDTALTLSSAIPEREGYVFKGWATSKNAIEAQYTNGSLYTKNAKITLYAVWEPETFTISFNENGGKGTLTAVTIKYGESIKMPNSVIKDGYYLKGWATKSNATAPEYELGVEYRISKDVNLYAVWGYSTWSGETDTKLEGAGTSDNPYKISDAKDLAYLAMKVNTQTAAPKYEYYKLTDNINLAYNEWVPIGLYGNENQYFYGCFDGDGYTISDFYATNINEGYLGLFGYVKDSEIKNLTISGAIENVDAGKDGNIGGLVAKAENIVVTNCTAMCFNVSAIEGGGVVMISQLQLETLYANVGVLIGHAVDGRIENCNVNESHINIKSGYIRAGLLAGKADAKIKKCYVTATEDGLLSAEEGEGILYIGGLCGSASEAIENCTVLAPYFSNTIEMNAYVGGMVGSLSGSVKACSVKFTSGKTVQIDNQNYVASICADSYKDVGGIVGYNASDGVAIVDCKYEGDSIIANSIAGGLIGSSYHSLYDKISVDSDESIQRSDLPEREGYRAIWYTDPNYETKYSFAVMADKDFVIYAKWEKADYSNDIWNGSSSEPSYDAETMTYTITNAKELAWIADVTNGEITSGRNFPSDVTFSGYTIELANNIYLNDTSNFSSWGTSAPANTWVPIGYNEDNVFSGTFEGNNFEIYGIYTLSLGQYHGLFGRTKGASINSIIIKKSRIGGSRYTGSIVGYADEDTVVRACKNDGQVYAVIYGGGIVGYNYLSSIYNCENRAKVTATNDYIGGIAGYSNDTIRGCYNSGKIYSEGGCVGGIVGLNSYNTIEFPYTSGVSGCRNSGSVEALGDCVGGIAGINRKNQITSIGNSSITYCYNSARKIVGGNECGGIVGSNTGKIKNCYNEADISGDAYVGGIAGDYADGSVQCVYSIGGVSGDSEVGGLFGYLGNDAEYCYTNQKPIYGQLNADELIAVEYRSSTDLMKLENLEGFSTEDWYIDDEYPLLTRFDVETYMVTVVEDVLNPELVATRCFADVNGIVRAGIAGGLFGLINGSSNSAVANNLLAIADRIVGTNGGQLVGENRYDTIAVENGYYNSDMVVDADAVNVMGTSRTERLMKIRSFQESILKLKPYTTLENIEQDETAVWVITEGELPELYHNCLNDIVISKDIVNGKVCADKAQAVDGEIVTVTATAADGYVLNAIYLNGEELIDNTFFVSGDAEIYATFSEKIAEYTVKVEANDNAKGSLVNLDNSGEVMLLAAPDTLKASDGEEIQVNVTADADYTVDAIYVNGEEVVGNNFIVTDNTVVTMEVVDISTDIEAVTNDAGAVGVYFAELSGSVEEGSDMVKYIRYWKTDAPEKVYTTTVQSGGGSYSAKITDLDAATEYSFQMLDCGEVKTFTTLEDHEETEEFEEEFVSVTGVNLDKTTASLAIGESTQLTATVAPNYATNTSVTWRTSDTSVATVTSDGVVTARSAGSAEITVTTEDGNYSAVCTVNVRAATVQVTGISVSKTSIGLSVGGFEQLTATVTPSDATDKSVTWSCNNESVAMVSSTGLVVGTGVGTAVIIAKANDGNHTAFCVVTVSEPISGAPEEPEIILSGKDPLKVTLYGELEGKVIVALYTGNVMTEIKILNPQRNMSVDFTRTGNRAKVMWVNSISSLEPKCEAKTQNLN